MLTKCKRVDLGFLSTDNKFLHPISHNTQQAKIYHTLITRNWVKYIPHYYLSLQSSVINNRRITVSGSSRHFFKVCAERALCITSAEDGQIHHFVFWLIHVSFFKQINKHQITKAKATSEQWGNCIKEREEDVEGIFGSNISRVTEERANHGSNDIIAMGKPSFPLCLIRESGRDGGIPGNTGILAKKCTLQQIVTIFHSMETLSLTFIHWPKFRKEYDK